MRDPNVAYFATLLAFNAPYGGVLLGTMSIKFCTEVKGWLRYKTASTNVTDDRQYDRRICDCKDPNVT